MGSDSDGEYGPPYIIPDFDLPRVGLGMPVTPVENGPAKFDLSIDVDEAGS